MANNDKSTTPTPTIEPHHKQVINLLLISAFVVILNETIMGVAIPRLMGSFGVPASSAQWLTTAFLLTMATVIPVTGFMLQRLNTRPIFMLAMSLFSLGTLAAVFAPSLHLLVAARVVQACGTAIMMPLLMTTVMTLVPPELRGRTMGNISIVISVAPAIGPTLSGIVLNYLDWRWLFILVLPISIGALLLGVKRIENVTTPRYAPLDLLSVVLSAFAFGGLVYGVSTLGETNAPQALPTWVPLVVGIVAMAVFIGRQLSLQKRNAALLDLRTFQSRNFTVCLVLMALLMGALFGVIILLPIYLQNVLGLSTLQTGLLLLPGGLLMGLLAPKIGRLYDRVGPRPIIIPGIVIVSVVLWAMTQLGAHTPASYILAGHIVMSVGFALLFTPLFTTSLSSVKPELYSHGSAMLASIQQVAGAAGVALLIALMSSRSAKLLVENAAPIDALTGGIRTAFFTAAIVSLVAVACVFFVRRPGT
ncbi:MAG: DHA2 family efflux MFS transporter permease subunit [Steroidobacteraceae bacterium]